MKMLKYTVTILVFAAMACTRQIANAEKDSNTSSGRFRRQLPVTSGDACLQIYSVPKQSVRCEPTDDVIHELHDLRQMIREQNDVISSVKTKLDELEFTNNQQEVTESKVKVAAIQEKQRNQEFRHEDLEQLVRHLRDRLGRIETQEREEITSLVTAQMDLIAATLTKSNTSIHDKYIDKLANHSQNLMSEFSQLKELVSSELDEGEVRVLGRLESQNHEFQQQVELISRNLQEAEAKLQGCSNETDQFKKQLRNISEVVHTMNRLTPRILKVRDCQSALTFYQPVSGVYSIHPIPGLSLPTHAYCDMINDQQAWTVILRRQDGSVDFFRRWDEYRSGFGDPSGEYWIGFETVHQLTNRSNHKLRVDLEDWAGQRRYAEYDVFSIADENHDYTLFVDGYHGDAGDSLQYHRGAPFSALDRNNDKNEGVCAAWCHGAWWYRDCFHSNLGGRYYNGGPYVTKTGWGDGVVWKTLKNTNFYSVKTAVMKIKPA